MSISDYLLKFLRVFVAVSYLTTTLMPCFSWAVGGEGDEEIPPTALSTFNTGSLLESLKKASEDPEYQKRALVEIRQNPSAFVPQGQGNILEEHNTFDKGSSGSVTIHGDVNADIAVIVPAGNLTIHGKIKTQDALLASLFGGVTIASQVERIRYNSEDFDERILYPARVEAAGILKIFAADDIVFRAAETQSALRTHIFTLAKIYDLPVVEMSQRITHHYGKYSGTETHRYIHEATSSHSSGGTIAQQALGGMELVAPEYTGKELTIEAQGTVLTLEARDRTFHESNLHKDGGFFGGSKTLHSVSQSSTARGLKSNVEGKSTIVSHAGNLLLSGVNIDSGDGIHLAAPEGRIVFRVLRDHYFESIQTSSSSALWNKSTNSGYKATRAHGSVLNPGTGTLEVDAPEVHVEERGDRLSLEGELQRALSGKSGVVWKAIHDEYESWHEEHESLGGPAAVVISIAASILMPGIGTGVVGAILTAAASTLSSQAAVALISNRGDIGDALRDITSERSLRSLGVSMFTAGLTQGLLQEFDINTCTDTQTFGDRLREEGISAASQTAFRSTLGQEDIQDSFLTSLRTGFSRAAGGHFASEIGEARQLGEIDYVSHKVLHALLGAAEGGLASGDPLSGAIGAVVGEVVAEEYRNSHVGTSDEDSTESYDEVAKQGTDRARFAAALVAAALDQDPSVASETGTVAARNNAFFVPLILAGIAAYDLYEIYHVFKTEGPEAGLKRLSAEIVLWWTGAKAVTTSLKVGKFALKIGGKVLPGIYPSIEAAWIAFSGKYSTFFGILSKVGDTLAKFDKSAEKLVFDNALMKKAFEGLGSKAAVAASSAEKEIARSSVNFSRKLTPEDLGIRGKIEILEGTFSIQGKAATVRVDMIDAKLMNPHEIVSNLVGTARGVGAETLRIEGSLANPRLQNVLSKRYGMTSQGANDSFIIQVK